MNEIVNKIVNKNYFKPLRHSILFLGLLLICLTSFAEGKDLLQNTEADLVATITGTGKKYLYLAELVVACYYAVKTRSPAAFLGILALSAGFNILLKIAGV